MTKRLYKTFNYLLSAILGMLGFQSCDEVIPGGGMDCMYGTPSAHFVVGGKVVDEDNKPVADENILIRPAGMNYGVRKQLTTDADGNYKWDETGFPMNKLKVVAIDPDSIYENDSTEITLKQTEKGDGDWYDGKYEGKADFKLKKRK